MPKNVMKQAVHGGIQGLQSECKAILQKLTVAHQDSVKTTEKAAAKIKAQWVKADQAMKKAKEQLATIKGKSVGKKTAAHKKQADKATMAFTKAKTLVRSLKQELSALLPELKAAKAALKRHVAIEKVASKKIVTVKAKKATPAQSKKTKGKSTRAAKAKSATVADPS